MINVRQQTTHKGQGMADLLLAWQAVDERLHKLLQSRHHILEDLRCQLTFLQDRRLACFKFPFRKLASMRIFLPQARASSLNSERC